MIKVASTGCAATFFCESLRAETPVRLSTRRKVEETWLRMACRQENAPERRVQPHSRTLRSYCNVLFVKAMLLVLAMVGVRQEGERAGTGRKSCRKLPGGCGGRTARASGRASSNRATADGTSRKPRTADKNRAASSRRKGVPKAARPRKSANGTASGYSPRFCDPLSQGAPVAPRTGLDTMASGDRLELITSAAPNELTPARCSALLLEDQLASMWSQPPAVRIPNALRRGKFHERRRRANEAACWDEEGADFFQRAAAGTDCGNTSWFDFATRRSQEARGTKHPMPALVGFLDDTARLCTANRLASHRAVMNEDIDTKSTEFSPYKRLAAACESADVHILMLWRASEKPWSMCTNFKWLMCVMQGRLPNQRGNDLIFASAPPTLNSMHEALRTKMDRHSFSGDLVYHHEICLLASMCDNGEEVFRICDSRTPFRCAFNGTRFDKWARAIQKRNTEGDAAALRARIAELEELLKREHNKRSAAERAQKEAMEKLAEVDPKRPLRDRYWSLRRRVEGGGRSATSHTATSHTGETSRLGLKARKSGGSGRADRARFRSHRVSVEK